MEAYVMVGAPGSGKSTFVSNLVEKEPSAVVISGDEIREELYGNADIQGDYSEIHDRMLQILEDNVGRLIVLDGTHYRASYRKEALAMLKSYGYNDVSAIVVNRPLDVCLRQNSCRKRQVPEHVIQRMHNALQASVRGIDREGFNQVIHV
jgi:predicted kinase